ncbi:hypothetical protein HY251_10295 [bacterium]|nr:hypothetical protein [bacterium]
MDLVRFLEPSSLDAVALSAIDPAHGPVDATAIAHLIGSGREGALAVLRSLGTGAQPSRDVIDTIGQLHSRAVAAAGLSREDVPDALRRYLLAVVGDESLCGCTVLAGALQLAEARPQLEDLLSAYSKKALRNAAVISLELLADPRSRPALEAALSRATSAAEKLLLDRALSALA